jgi:hypothetical protein
VGLHAAVPDDDLMPIGEREQLVAGQEVEDVTRGRHARGGVKVGRRGGREQRNMGPRRNRVLLYLLT